MLDDLPPFLTVEQAAKVVQLGRSKAYELTVEWETHGRGERPALRLVRPSEAGPARRHRAVHRAHPQGAHHLISALRPSSLQRPHLTPADPSSGQISNVHTDAPAVPGGARAHDRQVPRPRLLRAGGHRRARGLPLRGRFLARPSGSASLAAARRPHGRRRPRGARQRLRRRPSRWRQADRPRHLGRRLRPHALAVEVGLVGVGARQRRGRPPRRGVPLRRPGRGRAVPRSQRLLRPPGPCWRLRRARRAASWVRCSSTAPAVSATRASTCTGPCSTSPRVPTAAAPRSTPEPCTASATPPKPSSRRPCAVSSPPGSGSCSTRWTDTVSPRSSASAATCAERSPAAGPRSSPRWNGSDCAPAMAPASPRSPLDGRSPRPSPKRSCEPSGASGPAITASTSPPSLASRARPSCASATTSWLSS